VAAAIGGFAIGVPVACQGNTSPDLVPQAAAQSAKPAAPATAAGEKAGLREVLYEMGPARTQASHRRSRADAVVCAVRYTMGGNAVYGIRYPGDDRDYELDLASAEQLKNVFRKIADSERPKPTMVSNTTLMLEIISIKGNPGRITWYVQNTEVGHGVDVSDAKENVAALEAALKDVETLKKTEPAYKP
jgi:hypothetical protein